MGQALYRKYRSKSLDEIVGQEHIITALRAALKQGRLSHAYLFTGPRGVGKTSVARILAHEINGLSYTEEDAHIDIIEIDAASNRGIDEIRELREKVYVAPASGKYKVYIIDEVHMLTTQAFNALLKTLEEPPQHVVFILATTEVHKLPATIISRTQRYTFRPADHAQLIEHLRSIAKKEKISIDDDALALIAEHGDGSFRDSVGLLDQLGGNVGKIEAATVHEVLGIPPKKAILRLIETVQSGIIPDVATQLGQLMQQGFTAAGLAKEIGIQLRAGLLGAETAIVSEQTALDLLKDLIDVPTSAQPMHFLEICLLRAIPVRTTHTEPAQQAKPQPAVSTVKEVAHEPQKPAAAAAVDPKRSKSTTEKPSSQKASKSDTARQLDEITWTEVLTKLKSQYNTLYSIIRMAHPEFSPGKLQLTFAFIFHQKRLNEAKNKAILGTVITEVTGEDVEIECLFNKNAKPTSAAASAAAGAPMETVSNIFGGGELLES